MIVVEGMGISNSPVDHDFTPLVDDVLTIYTAPDFECNYEFIDGTLFLLYQIYIV